ADTTTRPFEIGQEAWRESIWKAINFMYSERCGTVIPGIHGICHLMTTASTAINGSSLMADITMQGTLARQAIPQEWHMQYSPLLNGLNSNVWTLRCARG